MGVKPVDLLPRFSWKAVVRQVLVSDKGRPGEAREDLEMVRGGAGALTVWGSPFMQQLTKCICLPQVLKTSKILHQNKSPLIAGMCALKLPAEGAKRQSCPVRAQTENAGARDQPFV